MYNLNYNNSGGDLMTNHPDKKIIREKFLKSHTDTIIKMSLEERKEKFGKCGEKNGMYGKTHTEEVRKKFSEMHKGNSYCKGKKLSEEIREKMSKNAKLKIGEKNPFFGKHHSEETIQQIKEKNKGRLPPNTIKISIDGNNYISITEAARQLNKPTPTILWRLKSKNPKFNGYKYIEEIFKQPSEILCEDDVGNCEVQNLQLDNH